MTTNIKRYIATLLSAALLIMVPGCNDDEAVTYSMSDVSSSVTGFNTDVIGAGKPLIINGSNMEQVARVFIGNVVVTRYAFTNVSSSSITVPVPLTVSLGENNVLIVFDGEGRASKKLTIVPLPAFSSFTPTIAAEGDFVTILGTNLGANYVSSVNVGGVSATIEGQSGTSLTFKAPAGFSTNKISLVGPGGVVDSGADLQSCSAAPASIECATSLTLNAGFELGSGDDFTNWGKWNGGTTMVATTVPGEFYSGKRALKVVRDGTLGSGQWRIQLASDPATWEVGASYTVYVRARASVAGGSIRVSTNPNAMYTADQNVTTAWQLLAFTFPSANEASSRVVLDLNGNNTIATTFFIDDVKLVKN